jgi:hypothetical protein
LTVPVWGLLGVVDEPNWPIEEAQLGGESVGFLGLSDSKPLYLFTLVLQQDRTDLII